MSCAGFFILDSTEKLLLLGENKHGYQSPQKGGIEPFDDSLFKCATRETFEESGISLHELQFSNKEYIEKAPSGKPNIIYWLAKLKNPKSEFKFDPDELQSVQWYEITQLLTKNKLKIQRVDILKQIITDLPKVVWEDDINQKRFLRCNPPNPKKKKNPHDAESRSLVKLLRHDLDSKKIVYDGAGYVSIEDIIKQIKTLTLSKIQEIVEYDNKYDKQRLDLKLENNNCWKMRANQGHSLKHLQETELLEELFEPLPFCIHGTEKKFLNSIQKSGLSKMGRTHIHCISKDPTSCDFKSVISGFKKTSNCYITIDMKLLMESGHKWFVSKNGVLLTIGPIPARFFLSITDL